jgi:hypothetical protein
VRASFDRTRFAVQAFAEHGAHDSTLRADAGFWIAPIVNRITIAGQAGVRKPIGDNPDADANFVRADISVRLAGLHLSAGVIQRDSVVSRPPVVFEASITDASTPSVVGQTFGISGAIYKDFGLDVHGVLWNEPGYYRPKTEVSGRVYLESDWRSKFPQGHFTIRASLLAQHRSEYLIPLADGDVVMVGATPVTSILEIRIKSATLSWQFRNAFGASYETVPGFRMPRLLNLYGVRWNFTN